MLWTVITTCLSIAETRDAAAGGVPRLGAWNVCKANNIAGRKQ